MASREDVEIRLKHIQARLDELKSLLRPILGNPIQVTLADVEPFGTAQVQVALAYTMQTLFYTYMNMRGMLDADHPIYKDLERVKGYVEKVRQARDVVDTQRQRRINSEAANRFVRNALFDASSRVVESDPLGNVASKDKE